MPFRTDDKTRWPRIVRRAQPIVELLLLTSVTAELIERHRLHVPPLATLPAEVHVIGDSLSAGIASEQEHLWPNLLANESHVPVRNHAQAGATTASAFRQAEEIDCNDCLVLIEIGGNDLLGGRDSRQIEADLDRLLVRLNTPKADRTLVMFELPVPPIPGGYEFARLQRRLAHRHAVRPGPRTLRRYEHTETRDRVAARMATPEAQTLFDRRSSIAKTPFGDIKGVLG